MVHADDSFLGQCGRSAARPPAPTSPKATQDPTIEEWDRAFAAHGITNVGPPMEQAEAERLLGQLAGAAALPGCKGRLLMSGRLLSGA
jgi:hypothetical protein